MLFLQKPRTVVVLITYIISIVSSRAVVENRPASFSKRTFTFDGACDAHPEISRGVSDATTLATHAVSTLQNPNPSINKQTWQDLRTALFGSETLSPTASIVGLSSSCSSLCVRFIPLFHVLIRNLAMYDNIASNPDVSSVPSIIPTSSYQMFRKGELSFRRFPLQTFQHNHWHLLEDSADSEYGVRSRFGAVSPYPPTKTQTVLPRARKLLSDPSSKADPALQLTSYSEHGALMPLRAMSFLELNQVTNK